MKFRKLIAFVILIIIAFFSGQYLLKECIFPFRHKEAIIKYSKENDLDPYFVVAVIMAESRFEKDAKSHKNALGLMQITEGTGKWIAEEMELTDYSPDKLYNEEYNIKMGCWYLNNLREEFGEMDLYIAAYNAGRGRVNEWLLNKNYSSDGKTLNYIPYKETKKYVDKVKTYYRIYKMMYE
ncbi:MULTISPECIES: lytic transglycosylase domain-containing protein [Clostridium]|uniref:Lytic transglycosylase domain-containing protein n=1 Tax=Clostridium cibarium TaxID=2762247 RepID=A0ABR8PVI3_9CLOT|nr:MULTISPECIES: lytic transglycosylase domain-containing protein [Clostridium]MBD7912191.1 lytic transglycosylase domain-containing protein [Clostridium cibarium]